MSYYWIRLITQDTDVYKRQQEHRVLAYLKRVQCFQFSLFHELMGKENNIICESNQINKCPKNRGVFFNFVDARVKFHN